MERMTTEPLVPAMVGLVGFCNRERAAGSTRTSGVACVSPSVQNPTIPTTGSTEYRQQEPDIDTHTITHTRSKT